jgi:hypothetical protein
MSQPEAIPTREPVVIQVKEYEGLERLDIRHWFSANGHLAPTKKGVNVPTSYAQTLLENIMLVSVGANDSIMAGFGQTHVKVCRNEYKGKLYLDIRHYFAGKTSYAPTPKGVSIPWEYVKAFLKALADIDPKYGEIMGVQMIEQVPPAPIKPTEPTSKAYETLSVESVHFATKVSDNRFANVEL